MSTDHLALLHVFSVAPNDTSARDIAMERQILARMSALPGVISVGISGELEFGQRRKLQSAGSRIFAPPVNLP